MNSSTEPRPFEYAQIGPSIHGIPGFLVPGQEQWLFEKVRSLPDDAVVEIGSLYGRSSCAMGYACVGSRRRVFCVDPWKFAELGDLDFIGRWQANIVANRLDSHVIPMRGRSHDVLARWNELTGGLPIDFVFVDGWHEYASVLRDFELVFPLVKTGGWIALHDVCPEWPGPMGVWLDVAAPSLGEHERCSTIACGQKHWDRIVGRPTGHLSAPRGSAEVHYFTELHGREDLSLHLRALRQCEFPWRWHLVQSGAPSPEALAIATDEPRVTLHAPKSGCRWADRVEALSTVLSAISDECILWRIDPQDRWLPEQLAAGRELLISNPSKTALVLQSPSGNQVRAWHCHPWFRWTNADEPFLAAFLADGTVVNVGDANPILPHEAARVGLMLGQTRAAA